jgi:hypothetical protein
MILRPNPILVNSDNCGDPFFVNIYLEYSRDEFSVYIDINCQARLSCITHIADR